MFSENPLGAWAPELKKTAPPLHASLKQWRSRIYNVVTKAVIGSLGIGPMRAQVANLAAGGGAAAATIQAIKASGVIIRVEPGEFSQLMNRPQGRCSVESRAERARCRVRISGLPPSFPFMACEDVERLQR